MTRAENPPAIRLVVFDVDGVLTDGTLYIDGNGEVMKSFSARDGFAVALLKSHGVLSGIISGKSSAALDFRLRQLHFDFAVTGRNDKVAALAEILVGTDIHERDVAYVGDDVIDLPLAARVRTFYAPADAHPLVVERADHVTKAVGGRGVAREVAEHVLAANGLSVSSMYLPFLSQPEDDAAFIQ